jgi:hypothetical protein
MHVQVKSFEWCREGKQYDDLDFGFRREVNEICPLFWDITQRRLVIFYRRFGTTYRSVSSRNYLLLEMGPTRCPETSVKNYHTTPPNIAEERRSQNMNRLHILAVKTCKPNATIGESGSSAVDNLNSSVSDTRIASSVISKTVTNNNSV